MKRRAQFCPFSPNGLALPVKSPNYGSVNRMAWFDALPSPERAACREIGMGAYKASKKRGAQGARNKQVLSKRVRSAGDLGL